MTGFSRFALAACAAVLVGQPTVAGEARPTPTRWTVSFKAFGPVRFGATVQEAEKVLKMKLSEDEAAERCHYAWNQSELPGIGFMVLKGKIARVDVSNTTHRTDRGAGVGMTEGEIKRAYPGISVEPHPYVPEGHYLVLASGDYQNGIVFETDGNVVTTFRAGWREPVGYIEGCE